MEVLGVMGYHICFMLVYVFGDTTARFNIRRQENRVKILVFAGTIQSHNVA